MPDKAKIELSLADNASLRILQGNDVTDDYVSTLNDPVTNQNMVIGQTRTETSESVRAYIDDNYNDPDSLLFGAFVDNQLMGTSRVHDLSGESPWMGVLVFNGNWRGHGWGTRIVSTVSDYVLQKWETQNIRAAIYQRNQASRQCFSKAGFVHEKNDELYIGPVREIWIKMPKNSKCRDDECI